MNALHMGETRNIQVQPVGQTELIEIADQLLMKYILIIAFLFNIIGYAPKGILGAIDYRLQQSIATYAALEILPPLCLLIGIGLLYKINKEIRKKITSVFRC
jgi:hypothetical protein